MVVVLSDNFNGLYRLYVGDAGLSHTTYSKSKDVREMIILANIFIGLLVIGCLVFMGWFLLCQLLGLSCTLLKAYRRECNE